MAGPVRIAILASGSQARREFDQTSTAMARLGRNAAKVAAGGAIIAGVAITKLGVDSVKAASAAQQSLGATETVFKQYADTVIKQSSLAAEAVGLSANEYRELANVTGAMLKNAGAPLGEVVGLTEKLTARAADLAATYGGSTREAIEAVNSLLRGEADPIERYGVSIKQADINARMAAKGLDKLEGSSRKQAEQTARLDLLFQQTKDSAGQFAREGNTLAGAQQRLAAEAENVKAKFGKLLLPALTDATNWASDELIPALEDLQGWLADNSDEFAEFGGTIKDTVLPPLEATVDILGNAVEVFTSLPSPVKELGIQLGIAALLFPKLASGATAATAATTLQIAKMKQLRAEMTYTETRTAALTGGMTKLGGAAKNAAGVGGMLALAHGATESNDAISVLSSTAGGALMGFSVGGPWGAAIGAGAGAMLGLATSTDKAEESARTSTTTWDSYRDSLDGVTGATTRATKAMIIQDLQEGQLLSKAADLGISQQTLVDGILGQTKARSELSAALTREDQQLKELDATRKAAVQQLAAAGPQERAQLTEQINGLDEQIKKRRSSVDAIRAEVGEVVKATKAKTEELAIINNLPENVVTRVQTPGAVKSAQDIAQLANLYGLAPKQIRTLIQVSGAEVSRKEVKSVLQEMEATEKGSGEKGRRAGNKFAVDMAGGVKSAVPSLRREAKNAAAQGAAAADNNAGFRAAGADSARGFGLGIAGMMTWVNEQARAMAASAEKAARAELQSKSPSKKFIAIGEDTALGFAIGVQDGAARTAPVLGRSGKKMGTAVAAGIVAGVTGGSEGVQASLDTVKKIVEKTIKGKNQEKREKAVLKSLKDQFAQLRANGAAQDALMSGNYLTYLSKAGGLYKAMTKAGVKNMEEARDLLTQLKQQAEDYAQSIRGTIAATGDITQMGRQEDGTVSITALLDELETAAINAEQYASLTQKFAAMGLSKTAIDQILAAGPASALATAEAIDIGGQEAVAQINALQRRLDATGAQLGKSMSDRYYKAGVDAAKGIVKGLEDESKNLDAAGVRMANALVKAVKKALKIKSPSKVFEGIGDNVIKGLDIGVDDTYAARIGSTAAKSLERGFSSPQLAAHVVDGFGQSALAAYASSTSSAGQVIRVELRLTAEQLSAAQRGKAILVDIDAARTSGARAKAVAS